MPSRDRPWGGVPVIVVTERHAWLRNIAMKNVRVSDNNCIGCEYQGQGRNLALYEHTRIENTEQRLTVVVAVVFVVDLVVPEPGWARTTHGCTVDHETDTMVAVVGVPEVWLDGRTASVKTSARWRLSLYGLISR